MTKVTRKIDENFILSKIYRSSCIRIKSNNVTTIMLLLERNSLVIAYRTSLLEIQEKQQKRHDNVVITLI